MHDQTEVWTFNIFSFGLLRNSEEEKTRSNSWCLFSGDACEVGMFLGSEDKILFNNEKAFMYFLEIAWYVFPLTE